MVSDNLLVSYSLYTNPLQSKETLLFLELLKERGTNVNKFRYVDLALKTGTIDGTAVSNGSPSQKDVQIRNENAAY